MWKTSLPHSQNPEATGKNCLPRSESPEAMGKTFHPRSENPEAMGKIFLLHSENSEAVGKTFPRRRQNCRAMRKTSLPRSEKTRKSLRVFGFRPETRDGLPKGKCLSPNALSWLIPRSTPSPSEQLYKLPMPYINADKPRLWKADIASSVDQFNRWFLEFAPDTFRSTRRTTTEKVTRALAATNDLQNITPVALRTSPEVISTLRMCTAPPLAVDRLIGLAGVSKSLVGNMEAGQLAARMAPALLDENLKRICRIVSRLLDYDVFPWLDGKNQRAATDVERERAATIVADRLCSAVANPIVRNAQEQRQLRLVGDWLDARGYRRKQHPASEPLAKMEPGTYAFRMNLAVGKIKKVNIPVDVVIQPLKPKKGSLPILIEAKSAGDFTNTNKRRKEEATKVHQLKAAYGKSVQFILFLCGYFGSDYLGYEAAEGIDWVWEHRIDDLAKLGI